MKKDKNYLYPFYFRLSFLIFTFLFLKSTSFAQQQNFKFEHITTEQGLTSNSISVILQDKQGFLWIGTRNGLNKYNGYDITIYRYDPENPNSLRDNVIESIYEDRFGIIWLGTQNGWLEQYNPKLNGFKHFKITPHILSLFEDSKGEFWIGTQEKGLFRFNRSTGETELVWVGKYFRSIIEDNKGFLWVSSPQEGIGKYNREQDQFEIYKKDFPVTSLVEYRPGLFFLGTAGEGLIQYNLQTTEETICKHDPQNSNSISSDQITTVYKDQKNVLWIGTVDGGLNRFDPQTNQFVRFQKDPADPGSINDNQVVSIYQDRSGILWIGTPFGGLNKLNINENNFKHYCNIPNNSNSLNHNVVNTILEDQLGNLWIGTFGGGLDRYDRDNEKWFHYSNDSQNPNSLSDDVVFSIYEDNSGKIWIGTDEGLDLFNEENDQFIHFPFHRPNDMIETTSGDFLIAATRGLFKFDPTEEQPFTLIREGHSWKISLLEDKQGNIWVGSSGDGVERFNPSTGEWQLFQHDSSDASSLSNEFVESILEDKSGKLWYATGGGLNRFDPETETFTSYWQKDGLDNDWVKSVIEDDQGHFWLSTDGGISRFDPKTEIFKNYSTDKLSNHSYRRGAYFQSETGKIFFGGSNGFNSFFPEQIKDNPHPPPFVLTKFSLFNQDVKEDIQENENIKLPYDQNFISFDFAALDFIAPEKNQYAYKMESIDEDWVQIGSRRHVDFPDLKPGDYTFRAIGSNNDGLWNEKGASFRIRITPPFWQTLWFKGFIILSILISIYSGYKIRVRKMETKRKELEERVEERTKAAHELQNALHEIERLKNRLQAENVYLQDEIKLQHNFANIITKSDVLKKVLRQIEQVASTDSTVLILGESGTGKELFARAIHNISARKNRPLVKIDCAALPANLIESELFGHEKGAFTGAISKKIGRFELANDGTIFLDEIGELSLELQTKLLRVLQDGEFERVGNPNPLKVDVRVIAATNRDLEIEKKNGNFREDLFYRLNVFPINIPPLRERKEDISLLVQHFTNKYSKKIGKLIDQITQNVIDNLQKYHWPGNVRELENVIERAVIISPEKKLLLGDWLSQTEDALSESETFTLEEIEKKHIITILEKTNWRISGEKGAAIILGINPKTLESRMKKLNILRQKS